MKAGGQAEALLWPSTVWGLSASYALFHAEPNMRCGYKEADVGAVLW